MKGILFSSIFKKVVMALAGLFLLMFLPVHLGINLLLLNSDPEPFTRAARFMAVFPLVRLFEVVLIAAILVHLAWGIFLQIQNWLARPVRYAIANKSKTSAFSRYMTWTGASIIAFLVLHFFNFFFIRLGLVSGNPEDFYSVAHRLFKIPALNCIYLVFFALLGLHLFHASSSAFQTLGLNHKIWTPLIRILSLIYAVSVPLGFAYISVTIWLFR